MTNPQAISPVVTAFLGLLSQADSVQVGSCPLLSSWDVTEPTGSEDNELVRFCWEDDSLIYAIVLTEGGIAGGRWRGDSFHCLDDEGDEVKVALYKLRPLTPSSQERSTEESIEATA